MNCCGQVRDTGRFFSFFADRYCRRLKKKGFERSQQQLMAALEAVGFADRTVLEIGCGVGHFHQTMVERGAVSAVGVDLASRMIALARQWAQERGIGDRVRYVEGDFVACHPSIPVCDVTVLDKVICCYPAMEALVDTSLARTRRVYAYTIPRPRWWVRAAMALGRGLMAVLGSQFRSYVHDPAAVAARVTAAGFRLVQTSQTAVWMSCVYVKDEAGSVD